MGFCRSWQAMSIVKPLREKRAWSDNYNKGSDWDRFIQYTNKEKFNKQSRGEEKDKPQS